MTDREAFLEAIRQAPTDAAPMLVYADWLDERGEYGQKWRAYERRGFTSGSTDLFDLYGNGNGNGDGYGYGYGDGYGDGYGYGYGDGYGDGYGYGYLKRRAAFARSAITKFFGRLPMVGQQVLVWSGRGFAWVGAVSEQTGPNTWKLIDASMLCRTGGASWALLARGKRRDQATFRHFPSVIVGPEIHGVVPWAGKLPTHEFPNDE